ncbi:transglutaminase [Primorskyibacter flagellatus]|uniref:Transglutaminase n=1 Tax=Primorskyibacter flagellatus TaxID=1387277 RepID=A0A916ZYI6_9RHOB|nr:transglutaminase family protein [Primorskyibacter flagellatus]GGE19240.1 transglutaminase [Primorskyibacter flagellatus]
MLLKISHTTRYRFADPVHTGLQQLRMTPKATYNQTVTDWSIEVAGASKQLSFTDQHRNQVDLISLDRDVSEVTITCAGVVDVSDNNGVLGKNIGPAPLWLYTRQTERTKPGPNLRRLARQAEGDSDLDRMHALMSVIGEAVTYEIGASEPDWTAETAATEGRGVCQDHAHVFIACARELKLPARYVSGYLLMDDRTDQDAMHAWAEVHLQGLGWVGFDVSNCICPDTRYVRVATGLDYSEAAPVTGTRIGGTDEDLTVQIEVAQQQ